MNILNENKANSDNSTRENLGFRFLLFRKAIGKTARELSSEANVTESIINGIESGTAYPGITFLHFLHGEYGLNINWLLTKEGQMFESGRPVEKKESMYEKYAELIELMRVPAVEQAINAALTQILALLRLEKDQEKQEKENEKNDEKDD